MISSSEACVYEIEKEGLKKWEIKSKEDTRKAFLIDLEGKAKLVFYKNEGHYEYETYTRTRDKFIFVFKNKRYQKLFIVKSLNSIRKCEECVLELKNGEQGGA